VRQRKGMKAWRRGSAKEGSERPAARVTAQGDGKESYNGKESHRGEGTERRYGRQATQPPSAGRGRSACRHRVGAVEKLHGRRLSSSVGLVRYGRVGGPAPGRVRGLRRLCGGRRGDAASVPGTRRGIGRRVGTYAADRGELRAHAVCRHLILRGSAIMPCMGEDKAARRVALFLYHWRSVRRP